MCVKMEICEGWCGVGDSKPETLPVRVVSANISWSTHFFQCLNQHQKVATLINLSIIDDIHNVGKQALLCQKCEMHLICNINARHYTSWL